MNKKLQNIALTIQHALKSNGISRDCDEIISRLNDLQFYGKAANAFDYMDYYYAHYYPFNILDKVVECCSPNMIVDSLKQAANDFKY